MPFSQVFEKHMNSEMRADTEQQQSRGKKADLPPPPTPDEEAIDAEYSEKKDCPPRFSTLFESAPSSPARKFESYPPPKRRSGVWLPMPLFVLLCVILLFESTLLFAYTVIGLYNNLPTRFVAPNAAGCNCRDDKPAINIAPNFFMPQTQALATQTVTVVGAGSFPHVVPTTSVLASSTPTPATPSANTSTTGASLQAAAVASDILGILHAMSTTSSSDGVATVTAAPTSTLVLSEVAQPSTVNSVTLVTVDAAGSTLPPRSTVTSVTVIDASQAAAATAAAESSISAAVASNSRALTPDPIPSSTTLVRSTASTDTPSTTGQPSASQV
ncbi:hypothetical protein BAUCODRAFT_39258, partial [Baudoinia panamericana UAMH 10762]